MSFNKKRGCCCGQTAGDDDFYIEVKTKIPIATAEKSQTGTYSFWIFVQGLTTTDGVPDDSNIIWEYDSNQINNEAGFDVTLQLWKSLTDRLVFVPRSANLSLQDTNVLLDNDGGGDDGHGTLYRMIEGATSDALRFRGFHMDASPRMLNQDDWEDLDEIRFVASLPAGINQSTGSNKFEAYRVYGYFFGLDQFDDTPAIGPTTFGDLTWEMYPKVNANIPVKSVFRQNQSTATKEFFDFGALFPSTFSVTVSGSVPVAYRRSGLEVPRCANITDPPVFDAVDISGTLVYNKEFDGIAMKYTCQTTGDDLIAGEKDIEWDVPAEDCFGIPLPALPDQSATIKVKLPGTGGNMTMGSCGASASTVIHSPQAPIAGCTNDIGYTADGNRLSCAACDPNSLTFSSSEKCSPGNYAGSFFKDKNFTDFFFNGTKDDSEVVDVTNPNNYPSSTYSFRRLNSLWACPVVVWGEATGTSVSLDIKAPAGPNLDSYLISLPDGSCGDIAGPHPPRAYGEVPVLGSEHIYGGGGTFRPIVGSLIQTT